MSTVIVHASLSLDGYLADPEGGVDWMFGHPTAPEDFDHVQTVVDSLGAVVGGANPGQTIEDGEEPYGPGSTLPVFLLTRRPHEPIVRNGRRYTFVVEDVARAVDLARQAAEGRAVSILGGKVSRQCLRLGLVDEIHLDILPVLLGEGISLFGGLGARIDLERQHTSGVASEAHLVYRVRRPV